MAVAPMGLDIVLRKVWRYT